MAVAPSYADFLGLAQGSAIDWTRPRVAGGAPEPDRILDAASALASGAEVKAIALDLPLASTSITGRRAADQAVSRAYGSRYCGTHSPTPARPGPISDAVRRGFEAHGFALATGGSRPDSRALLEVFPHTALLALLGAPRRVAYKVSRSRRYWPDETPAGRRERLLVAWRTILMALQQRIEVPLELPGSFASFSEMRRYEDALDAILCAWVAIEFLKGNAEPLGDEQAAIWTPLLAGERR